MIPSGKGVGVANWLVSKTSGLLDAKLSRRSFISRATLVGTAVAVTGCRVVTRPARPYTLVTECGPYTLCRDGWTEFCCVINQGVNACPPNTISAGWWRADYSVFCNGTRYYIDCNETCCGPQRSDGFCAGCQPCRCADGCNTRKVNCNYFRYGQCHQLLAHVGPIACRMVTCVPPYLLNIGCSPSGAVDNSTANHNADCARYGPPPPPPPPPAMVAVLPGLGGAVASAAGVTHVVARHSNGNLWATSEAPGGWSPWADLGASPTSGGTAVVDGTGNVRVYFRLPSNALGELRNDGSAWSAVTDLGALLRSDPVAISFGGRIYVFARLSDGYIWNRTFDGSTWVWWTTRMGRASSNPVVVVSGSTLFMFARLSDGALWYMTTTGGSWSNVTSLGGQSTSDPSVVDLGGEVFAFVRWSDNTLQYRRRVGAVWGAWAPLAGELTSDPVAFVLGTELFVFARWSDNTLRYLRFDGASWDPWATLDGDIASDPAPVLDGTTMRVFASFADRHLWHRAYDGTSWDAWSDLGGTLALLRGT